MNEEEKIINRNRFKKWYSNPKNALKVIKRCKGYRKRIKIEILNHYGNKCVCCGESHIEFLGIDHIKGNRNKHRKIELGTILATGYEFYLWLKRNNYPEGFQVMCNNCNIAKGNSKKQFCKC